VYESQIGFIGTGYVGLVTAACFAKLGQDVLCLEIDNDKIQSINNGISPIYETGLQDLLFEVVKKKRKLYATNDRKLFFDKCDIFFICLPTPSNSDGSINLKFILDEIKEIAILLSKSDSYKTIIIKSTVVPGTTNGKIKNILEKYSNKCVGTDFGLGVNPEFLMEGSAIDNFLNPDRIILGSNEINTKNTLSKIYNNFNCPIFHVTIDEGEMIKYVSNSFLATKISFINEIANLSEFFNINMDNIVKGIGSDHRISNKFFRSGLGFGGSCFPKDVKALLHLSKKYENELNILKSTLEINNKQPYRAIQILNNNIDAFNKKITILGLSFKPNTDDIRESPSLKICDELVKQGCEVHVYDPIYVGKSLPTHDYITISNSFNEAIKDSSAVILVTEWAEFKNLNPSDFHLMKHKLVIDGRRVLNEKSFINSNVKLIILGNGNK